MEQQGWTLTQSTVGEKIARILIRFNLCLSVAASTEGLGLGSLSSEFQSRSSKKVAYDMVPGCPSIDQICFLLILQNTARSNSKAPAIPSWSKR
jgi:hypothetical protein